MAVADEVASWIRQHAAPVGATVHAHRQPASFGADDVLVVALERQADDYLFGAGRGFASCGESEIRIGLWWIANRRRPAAQRTPQRALEGLQPVYQALLGVRRMVIGVTIKRQTFRRPHQTGSPDHRPIIEAAVLEGVAVVKAAMAGNVGRHQAGAQMTGGLDQARSAAGRAARVAREEAECVGELEEVIGMTTWSY
ncbi:MAG: hypothetical protein OXG04_09055 [Acidobacteria bacterium]|nr:hypothetical protein [Acidobacteriota bacterium]